MDIYYAKEKTPMKNSDAYTASVEEDGRKALIQLQAFVEERQGTVIQDSNIWLTVRLDSDADWQFAEEQARRVLAACEARKETP